MDRLEQIFKAQAKYIDLLRPIYEENGFKYDPLPVALNDRHAQEQFRLLAWRFTEEIYEALEVPIRVDSPISVLKDFYEEIADALHFLVELCLVSGVSAPELLRGTQTLEVAKCYDGGADDFSSFFAEALKRLSRAQDPLRPVWSETVRALALAMHYLRQRPWRTDDRLTERKTWVLGLHLTFRSFVENCLLSKLGPEGLYDAYFRKSKINYQRQEEQNR